MQTNTLSKWITWTCLVVASCTGVSADFLKRQIEVPVNYQVGWPLFHLPNSNFTLSNQTKILQSKPASKSELIDTALHFEIHDSKLVLSQPLSKRGAPDKLEYQLELISANVELQPSFMLKIRVVTGVSQICVVGQKMCFYGNGKQPLKYSLPDTLQTGVPFEILRHAVPHTVCPNTPHIEYFLESGNYFTVLDPGSGSLALNSPLRMDTVYPTFNITCRIQLDNQTYEYSVDADIKVFEINKLGPYLKPGKSPFVVIDISEIQLGKYLTDAFNVFDTSPQKYRPYLEGDVEGFFQVDIKAQGPYGDGTTLIHSALMPVKEVVFPGTSYEFKVIFENPLLLEKRGIKKKVVFFVKIVNSDFLPESGEEFETNISKCASRYAMVGNVPFFMKRKEGLKFHMKPFSSEYSDNYSKFIFNLTNETGIIYVENTTALRWTTVSFVELNVTWRKKEEEGYYVVVVDLLDENDTCATEALGQYCALHAKEYLCKPSSGPGSPSGRCQWRPLTPLSELSKTGYATCSPSLSTCPDGRCDELERTHPAICPQDCAKEAKGQVRAKESGGIEMGRGTCSCFEPDECNCLSELEPVVPAPHKSDISSTPGFFPNDTEPAVQAQTKDMLDDCGPSCVLVIAIAALISLGVASGCLFMYCKRHVRHRGKKQVGCSRISLSVVPSDYVDERRVSAGTPAISSALLQATSGNQALYEGTNSRKNSVDPKWEFPREKLILENVLGEGEFGQVVRGQALSIKGQPGYTVVAVKMLKENCSYSDRDDLLSELNLLKEVNHPNVIQLMGACTLKDGPLLVIVEYAELGSLRSYLRQCRRIDNLDRTSLVWTVENPSYITESTALKHRDLLSFSWQIARGMSYLSEMKVVHRDLATRNILLGSGKVVKISDFGLSRDVYEGDSYLKRSKGRVPVKWMALESLQDSMYTTKSDVWSFGIVLWEIVNLGASPYPGLTPERLFRLLWGGYRMERPSNCRKEIYELMCQCWRAKPSQRPSFKELTQKLDNLLQETADYMDLDVLENWAQGELLQDNDSSCGEEPFNLITYSCFREDEDTQVVYGNVSPLLDESPEPSFTEL